jgi:hypothetical protein
MVKYHDIIKEHLKKDRVRQTTTLLIRDLDGRPALINKHKRVITAIFLLTV